MLYHSSLDVGHQGVIKTYLTMSEKFCHSSPYTLNSAYNEKKYVGILHRYRWLFIKGDVFIGERGIFDAVISFVIGNSSLKVTSL